MEVEVVRAAGGVVERAGADRGGDSQVLIVHRPRYDDWTLPKGKAKPGESDKVCALREVEEETGLACELGEEVAVSEYEVAGRPKRVRYFAMTPPAGVEPRAQNEVDAVRWVTPRVAIDELTYARDAEVVRKASAPS